MKVASAGRPGEEDLGAAVDVEGLLHPRVIHHAGFVEIEEVAVRLDGISRRACGKGEAREIGVGESERAVTPDAPKTADSVWLSGTLAGVQLAAVFQSLLTGALFQVADCARSPVSPEQRQKRRDGTEQEPAFLSCRWE